MPAHRLGWHSTVPGACMGGLMDWVHHARCKDEDPELFFPIGTTGTAALQIAQAKAVCVQCDVRIECLEWAMATGQDAGVWGGLSEEERRALRRARRRGETAARLGATA
jgi:WhiB family redox-sensing transcriptional regulator